MGAYRFAKTYVVKKKYQRNVNLKPEDEIDNILFQCPEKIKTSEIRQAFEDDGDSISEKEAEELKDFLYQIGEIIYKHCEKEKTFQKTQLTIRKNEEGNFIHQSEYRRAS